MHTAILFSDTHLSRYDPYDLNPLKFKFLREIREQWKDEARFFFDLGDGQHRPLFDVELMSREAECRAVLGDRIDKEWVLSGNHELSKGKFTPLMPFAIASGLHAPGLNLVGQEPVRVGDFVLRGWSKDAMKREFPEGRFFLGHIPVDYTGTGWEGLVSVEDVQNLPYSAIFLGDIHQRYDIGKIHSVGTLFPSTFSDEGARAGYIVLRWDSSNVEIERIDIDYPQFRTVTINESMELSERDIRGNVVRLKFEGSREWLTPALIQAAKQAVLDLAPHALAPKHEAIYPEQKIDIQTTPVASLRDEVILLMREFDSRAEVVMKDALVKVDNTGRN